MPFLRCDSVPPDESSKSAPPTAVVAKLSDEITAGRSFRESSPTPSAPKKMFKQRPPHFRPSLCSSPASLASLPALRYCRQQRCNRWQSGSGGSLQPGGISRRAAPLPFFAPPKVRIEWCAACSAHAAHCLPARDDDRVRRVCSGVVPLRTGNFRASLSVCHAAGTSNKIWVAGERRCRHVRGGGGGKARRGAYKGYRGERLSLRSQVIVHTRCLPCVGIYIQIKALLEYRRRRRQVIDERDSFQSASSVGGLENLVRAAARSSLDQRLKNGQETRRMPRSLHASHLLPKIPNTYQESIQRRCV